MLLVDSLYINNSGGKVLLDYLVEELEKSDIKVFYLFDDRCKNDFQGVSSSRKLFLKASLWNRYRFYKNNQGRFSKIFCFGNIPPLFKQKSIVLTYFHQLLYLESSVSLYLRKNTSVKKFLRLYLRKSILKILKANTDVWFVQQDSIKNSLSTTYKVKLDSICLMPFFPPINSDGNDYKRMDNSYLYVGSGAVHKNHKLLINAFCCFYDKTKKGVLTLTVSEDFTLLCKFIDDKQKLGYPIFNIGIIKRDKLYRHYQTHQYLIFPSLAESFGLGLVEAIENGCKVIGADLDYMHDVCSPSLTFNPYDEDDLIKCLEISSSTEVKESYSKINNKIEQLIRHLS